jgi:hypothetical protein
LRQEARAHDIKKENLFEGSKASIKATEGCKSEKTRMSRLERVGWI